MGSLFGSYCWRPRSLGTGDKAWGGRPRKEGRLWRSEGRVRLATPRLVTFLYSSVVLMKSLSSTQSYSKCYANTREGDFFHFSWKGGGGVGIWRASWKR